MKAIKQFTLFLPLLYFCGCASTLVDSKAKERQVFDEKTRKDVGPISYGYYFLLPVTVPFDIATFPIQCIVMPLALKGQH